MRTLLRRYQGMIKRQFLPSGTETIPHEGLDLVIKPRRPPADQWYRSGKPAHSSQDYEVLEEYLNEGDVAVDLGASFGVYTCRMRRLVGKTGKIVSVEPDPINRELLRSTISKNRLDNVEVVDAAVDDTTGQAELITSTHGGRSRFGQSRTLFSSRVSVRTISICDLLDKAEVGRANIIKMDIEGAEVAAIKGAVGCFDRIGAIVIEVHAGTYLSPTEVCDLYDVLDERGQVFDISSGSGNRELVTESPTKVFGRRYWLWENEHRI